MQYQVAKKPSNIYLAKSAKKSLFDDEFQT